MAVATSPVVDADLKKINITGTASRAGYVKVIYAPVFSGPAIWI